MCIRDSYYSVHVITHVDDGMEELSTDTAAYTLYSNRSWSMVILYTASVQICVMDKNRKLGL